MRVLHLTLEEALAVSKALGNQQRMEMLSVLTEGPKNVNDLAERLEVPFSTAAVNIKKLEEAGLIATEIVPGRGSQKVSSKRFDRIVIDLASKKKRLRSSLHSKCRLEIMFNAKLSRPAVLPARTGLSVLLMISAPSLSRSAKMRKSYGSEQDFWNITFQTVCPMGQKWKKSA